MWLLSVVTVVALLRVLAHLEVSDVAGISALSWWWVLGSFVLCAAWFAYADYSGLTARKAAQRMAKRQQERLHKQRELLGLKRKR